MLIDDNIKALSLHDLNWIGLADGNEHYPQFIDADNKKIEYFKLENESVAIVEDSFDSNFEINPYKKELIFVIGINSINEIRQLYKKKNKSSIILVMEPRLSFFQHALHNKDLSVFSKENIYLFADSQIKSINEFLQPLMHALSIVGLAKNISFYITDYYRKSDFELSKSVVNIIHQVTRSIIHSIGNDVEDSLQGLKHNLDNFKYICESKNPAQVRDSYTNKPAIVVSAGPSLNKNINYLKEAKGKAVIIAVDTILKRLLKEGIIPDFVCSVERVDKVYEYFYKDVNIPETVTLVGPPLLDSRVFEDFKGDLLLPFRLEVNEYRWLQAVLEIKEDVGMLMGLSCAHVAFGLAHHLGCSPIILIGQDLAYGSTDEDTHASGTTYDNIEETLPKRNTDEIVEGYYGDKVKTTHIWTLFRIWFETQIQSLNLNVINATEGGAKIQHSQNLSLKESIEIYCIDEIRPAKEIISKVDKYKIDLELAKENFQSTLGYMNIFREKCLIYFDNISRMEINSITFNKKRDSFVFELNKIHELLKEIRLHPLLMHNIQAIYVKFLWSYNEVEELINVENLSRNRDVQVRFLGAVIVTVTKIEDLLNEFLKQETFIEIGEQH